MKDSFNYSGFCKCAYSFNNKKRARVDDNSKNMIHENPARRVPPYLAQTPTTRYLKWSE